MTHGYQLEAAIGGHTIVERAIGIMMNRNGGSEERATLLLHQMCHREHTEEAVMAREIVDEALGHAISRYTQIRLRREARQPRA